MPTCVMLKLLMFQSTLPTRGSDQIISENVFYDLMFQSTLPTRGSDVWLVGNSARDGVSIHAPHEGERHDGVTLAFDDGSVSIHAPHEGERLAVPKTSAQIDKVSIHAPHEGERPAA